MAFSQSLAARIRDAAAQHKHIHEKKMFGGVGFLLHGNMLVGVWQDALIVRIGLDAYETALAERNVREFDITGRPMRGWVLVEPDGVETDEQLRYWINKALDFVRGLPRKLK